MASSGYRGRVIFFDGFAGPGIYESGEPGSPIIALRTLLEHPQFEKWSKTEFLFVFFEPKKRRFASLTEQIGRLDDDLGGLPSNVKIMKEQIAFVDGAKAILETLDGKHIAPTFAFVDPFGFKGVPIDLICDLVSAPSCEVFFNFIADHVSRFIDHPNELIGASLEELFGTSDYQYASELAGEARLRFLHDLYKRQLHDRGGFEFVASFRMLNQRNKTPCWLFYGTRRIEGMKKMKDAMWKVDPAQGVRFSDRLAEQEVLLAEDHVDVGPLRAAIVQRFRGETVSVEQVERFVLADTPFSASHYNQRVLKPLEQDDEIVVVASQRKKRWSYPSGTVIHFR